MYHLYVYVLKMLFFNTRMSETTRPLPYVWLSCVLVDFNNNAENLIILFYVTVHFVCSVALISVRESESVEVSQQMRLNVM